MYHCMHHRCITVCITVCITAVMHMFRCMWSRCVHGVFAMFTMCSRRVHDVFTMCPRCAHDVLGTTSCPPWHRPRSLVTSCDSYSNTQAPLHGTTLVRSWPHFFPIATHKPRVPRSLVAPFLSFSDTQAPCPSSARGLIPSL